MFKLFNILYGMYLGPKRKEFKELVKQKEQTLDANQELLYSDPKLAGVQVEQDKLVYRALGLMLITIFYMILSLSPLLSKGYAIFAACTIALSQVALYVIISIFKVE